MPVQKLVLNDCIYVTDASIKLIAQRCTFLQVLSVANCPRITDVSLFYIAGYTNEDNISRKLLASA